MDKYEKLLTFLPKSRKSRSPQSGARKIILVGTKHLLDGKTDYLVRKDFARFIGNLGFDTVAKAVKRYSDEDRAKKILQRLDRIVYHHKHQKKVVKDFDGQVREWVLDFE